MLQRCDIDLSTKRRLNLCFIDLAIKIYLFEIIYQVVGSVTTEMTFISQAVSHIGERTITNWYRFCLIRYNPITTGELS